MPFVVLTAIMSTRQPLGVVRLRSRGRGRLRYDISVSTKKRPHKALRPSSMRKPMLSRFVSVISIGHASLPTCFCVLFFFCCLCWLFVLLFFCLFFSGVLFS